MINKNGIQNFLIDENFSKLYINSNTGQGKTLLLSIFALLFIDLLPEYTIISNFHLNIFDKKSKESKCIYSKFGLLPFSDLIKGKYIILLDDFIAVKKLVQNYGSILATLVRKLDIKVYISVHYYDHIIRQNRQLFNAEIMPKLTNLKYNYLTNRNELTNKSKIKLACFEPNSYMFIKDYTIYNVLELVKGNYSCNNIYVKGNLYNTNEVVERINEFELINEIIQWSKTKKDVLDNISLITDKKTYSKYLFKEVNKQFLFS